MLNLSIATENFEAKAGQLYSFPATPGKQCLLPKVSLGGLRDRTVEYTKWVLGITVFAQFYYYNKKIEAKAVRLYSFPATPGKQCLLPKVSLGGLRIVRLSILHGYWGLQYLLNLSIATENFEAKAVRLYSFSATPGKQCLPPKVSQGGLRDRTVEYTT